MTLEHERPENASTSLHVTALLLAGGRSRRLGQDKRFLPFEGEPLIVRAYKALQAVADEVWVLLAQPEDAPQVQAALGDPAVRFAFDPKPGAGPLGALAGALARVSGDYALLFAVDYPLMTASFLRRLRAYLEAQLQPKGPDVLVPLCQGAPQVTCAFYRRSLHKELQEALESGKRSLRRFVEGLPPARVQAIPETIWSAWTGEDVFFNLNTAEDLERLQLLETRTANLR